MAFPDTLDAATFVRDGKTAVATIAGASVEFNCWLDFAEDVDQFVGQSKAGTVRGKPQITWATADAALAHDVALTIDGNNYRVRWTRKLDDGVFSVAELAKA